MKVIWEKPERRAGLAVFGLMGLLILLLAVCVPVDRVLASLGHRCPMKSLTGHPCASCGSTRAFVAAGHLEFGRAFRFNPLATALFLILCVASPWAVLTAALGLPRPRLQEVSTAARLIGAALLVAAILSNWAYLLMRTPPS